VGGGYRQRRGGGGGGVEARRCGLKVKGLLSHAIWLSVRFTDSTCETCYGCTVGRSVLHIHFGGCMCAAVDRG
jgi:hypothetical protein